MSAIIFPSTQNFLSCKLFRISFVSLCLENVEREWMGTAVLSCSWFSSDYSPCSFTSYNVVVLFFLEPSPVHDSTIFVLQYCYWLTCFGTFLSYLIVVTFKAFYLFMHVALLSRCY